MKDLRTYISESILEAYKKPTESFIIKDVNGNDIEFEPSRYEILNKAFEWVSKHCVIDTKIFEAEKTPYKVDRVLFKTNEYELKSVKFYLDPEDKDLVNVEKIRRNKEEFAKLVEKYKGTLGDDVIIGQLIPFNTYNKSHAAYTEIILTNKNVLNNYIPDYAFPISDEKVV